MRSVVIALFIAALSVSGASAKSGSGTSSGTFRINATVAPSCSINYGSDLQIQQGISRSVVETCNIPGGFIVSANYRQLNQTEHVSLRYGGEVVILSPTGSQTLGYSTRASIRDVSMQFDDVKLDTPVALTLTIAPR